MLSKCCCCVPLRTGSLVIAVLGILGAFGIFVSSNNTQAYKCIYKCIDIDTGPQWANIVEGIFLLLPYGFLLFGALINNDKAVLVCLVLTALSIIIGIIFGIIAILNIETLFPELAAWSKNHPIWSYARSVEASKLMCPSLVQVYFWICIYSFYKELKEGGGEASIWLKMTTILLLLEWQ